MYKLNLVDINNDIVMEVFNRDLSRIYQFESFFQDILDKGGRIVIYHYGNMQRPDSKIDGFI